MSVGMLFRDSFNQEDAALLIEQAVEKVIEHGVVTRDLGGLATTKEMTDKIIEILK